MSSNAQLFLNYKVEIAQHEILYMKYYIQYS